MNTKRPKSWNEHQNTELQTLWTLNVWTLNFLNITFRPKIKFQTCWTSQKTKQFANIKLYVPRLVWWHNNRTELRTLPNITFWPKTELRTCRTSQKTEQFLNIKQFIPSLPKSETSANGTLCGFWSTVWRLVREWPVCVQCSVSQYPQRRLQFSEC